MSDECCGNCRFGKVRKENVKEVDCFRYPSTVSVVLIQVGPSGQPLVAVQPGIPSQPMYLNATPVMESADWCGEYQPKKQLVN